MAVAFSLSLYRRKCPLCASHDIARSRRRGVFEIVLMPFVLIRPFRCQECGVRFFGFFFLRKNSR